MAAALIEFQLEKLPFKRSRENESKSNQTKNVLFVFDALTIFYADHILFSRVFPPVARIWPEIAFSDEFATESV